MPPRPNIVRAFRGLGLQPNSVARYPRIRTRCCAIRLYSNIPQEPQPPPEMDHPFTEMESLNPSSQPTEPTMAETKQPKQPKPKQPKQPKKPKVPQIIEDMARTVLLSEGLKFPLPSEPISRKTHHHHDRYDPLLDQMTKEIMRDGKLSQAQRHMSMVLNFLQTSPTPRTNPQKPLAPGSPPPSQLPLDPLKYLQVAVDSVAPLIKVRSLKGMAGGGAALDLPVPLSIKQRRRTAIKWILDIVRKKPSTLSGRERFAHRLSQEIIAIVQGNSPAWNLRQSVHKLGTTARANLNAPALRKKGMQRKSF